MSERQTVSVRMDKTLYLRLKQEASQDRRKPQNLIEKILLDYAEANPLSEPANGHKYRSPRVRVGQTT